MHARVWQVGQHVEVSELLTFLSRNDLSRVSRHRFSWGKLVHPLYQAGCDVVILDWPGFHQSSGRDVQTSTWKV